MEVFGYISFFAIIIFGILLTGGMYGYAKTFDPDYDEDEDEEWSMPKKKKKKR